MNLAARTNDWLMSERAFAEQGGAILGDLPPYESFPIGGTNSVRGYDEGEVGSGRHFIVASAEAHAPLVNNPSVTPE